VQNATILLKEYYHRLRLVPVGVGLLLLSYSLTAIGSPMPPHITWLEIIIGCGLLLGGSLLLRPTLAEIGRVKKAKQIVLLAVVLLFVPLVWGLYNGNGLGNQIRDLIPLLFLLAMPILLTLTTSSSSKVLRSHLIAITIAIVGSIATMIFYSGVLDLYESPARLQMLMSGVFSQPQAGQITAVGIIPDGIRPEAVAEVLIKLYDPAILFTSILFCSAGIVLLVKSWQSTWLGIALIGCGAIIAYGFMIAGLRAYTALLVLAVFGVCVTQIKQRGLYTRVLPMIVIGMIALWVPITSIIQLLMDKQQMVGTNGKEAEWLAVIAIITASPQTLLFGLGWGGTFENPILGEQARYTHSMLSFYLLKSGLIGFGMLMLIVGWLLGHVNRIGGKEPWDITRIILLVSCLPPLIIGIMFQPIYKMLSYGLILTLFMLVVPGLKKHHESNY